MYEKHTEEEPSYTPSTRVWRRRESAGEQTLFSREMSTAPREARGRAAVADSSSQPCIWAVPGAVIPQDGSVSIFCRAPPGVTTVRLHHEAPGGQWYDREPEGTQETVHFSLLDVKYFDAGIYSCEYFKGGDWSRCNESLELVVTGAYQDKPSLAAHPAAQVASGGTVTLRCQPLYSYDTYVLCRGGGASFPQDCSHQHHSSFLIAPVSLDQAGTYTCYGSHNHSPQQWSLPSDPLQLSVTRPAVPIVISASAAAAAFLLLVLLLLLLLLCLRRRRAKRRAACDGTKGHMRHSSSSPPVQVQGEDTGDGLQDAEPEADRQRDTQVPAAAAEDPQEVTYAQLHPTRLRAGVDPLPPRDPEPPSTQPCVYATLTLS
ncbi:PREDICTED: leukocyte immunoglobulin-like receptor subfamily B member 3 isoform X3 [Chinchilla lanigera]|uniref:leukocyte immunoglobulin-like receptor subfamily B member 3 isoform X3 n=1 Tax=Chinchilla lanigera TaxID=34839 RepID=UPI000697210C|nr:PREDICTED: leukocyte immunoglobulin-like receptor subfamily B member 3 isoform X3 [Chinchilla lanigera]